MMSFDGVFLIDELRIKNDILQKKNEILEAEIHALKYEHANFVGSMRTYIDGQKEAQKILSEHIKAFITAQFMANDTWQQLVDLSDLELSLADKSVEFQDMVIGYQDTTIEKYKKAPIANKLNTDTLWEPYIQKFDDYIADGKAESWAKNKIGELMEKDGVWKKTSKKDPQKIITRPNRGTLHKQLVTNRK